MSITTVADGKSANWRFSFLSYKDASWEICVIPDRVLLYLFGFWFPLWFSSRSFFRGMLMSDERWSSCGALSDDKHNISKWWPLQADVYDVMVKRITRQLQTNVTLVDFNRHPSGVAAASDGPDKFGHGGEHVGRYCSLQYGRCPNVLYVLIVR